MVTCEDMFRLLNLRKHRLLEVDQTKSIRDARYIVIDTELTGLNEKRDSIVSVGALRMVGGRIDLGNSFYRLVNPETSLTAESVVIHEITPSEVVEKPGIEAVLTEFLEFCGDDIIVGHYVSIDLAFLNREMVRIFGSRLKNRVLDTAVLFAFMKDRLPPNSTFVTPPRDYRNLYDIAKFLGVPVSGAHNAVMDAFITAQVFQRLIPMLLSIGIRNVGHLLKLSERGGDSFRTSYVTASL